LPQPGDELALAGQDLRARHVEREPLRTIDLREGRLAATLRRPFQLESIRLERRGIEIAFDREGGDDLAPRLRELAKRVELTAWMHSSLFHKFADCAGQRLVALGIFPFRNRPRAEILPSPERPARVHQQNLEALRASPVHQNAG